MQTTPSSPSTAGVTIQNGGSVRLDQPAHCYLIQSGRFEIYAMLGGRRMYLAEIAAGQSLMCAPCSQGQLIAIAPEGGVLVVQAAASLSMPVLSSMADNWVLALSESLVRLGQTRPTVQAMGAGMAQTGHDGQHIHSAKGVLWVVSKAADLRFLGVGEPSQMVPISPMLWARVTAAGPLDFVAAELFALGSVIQSLSSFHGQLLSHLHTDLIEQSRLEAERIAQREEQVAQDLANVMEGHERILESKMNAAADDDLVYAWRMVAGEVPAGMNQSGKTDFIAFADSMHTPYRRVSLTSRWWNTDMGPLIGQRLEDGRPVALVPDWRGRYRLHVQGSKPQRVNASIAATLDTSAFSVVKPLPERKLRPRDLVIVAIASCAGDLSTLMVATLGASLLGLLIPIATGHIIDTFVPSEMRGQLWMLGIMLVVAQLCAFLLKASSDLARQRIDGRVAARLQGGVMDRVFRMPSFVLRTFSSTDLAMRVISIDGIRRTVTGIALNTLLTGVFGLTSIGLLFYYDVYGALVALSLFVVLAAAGTFAGYKQINALLKGEQMSANVATFTQQLMENISTLRVFGAEKRAYIQWSRNSIEMRKRGLRAKRISISFDTLLSGYDLLAMASVFIVLGRHTEGMSSGSFMAFAAAYANFLNASIGFGRAMLPVAGLIPMYARVKPLMENTPERSGTAQSPGRLSGALEVANVAFAYPGGPKILTRMNFRVEPGQFVALVGASGCGKSTLVNLLLGVDKPEQGAILFDGNNLADLDVTAVRRQFGVCRQNGRMFSGTLYENILGAHSGTQADVWEAARLAGIDEEIRALPMQLHTVVTEGSATFSGGQIQRLLLARALVGNPRFVVLDEATSALDNITQDLVVRNVERLGVTRIVVAHRLSTIRNADVILFIRDGQVSEAGNYDELYALGGDFARFVKRQSL
ncbi:MAG: ATP-binding cassette domain-containing protein [Pseudomonadota bacterium]